MLHIVNFRPEHALTIDLQSMQQGTLIITEEIANALAQIGPAFTGRADDGSVLCCAGMWLRHRGVAESWALVSGRVTGATLLTVTRAVRRFLDHRMEHRISGTTLTGWDAGRRWLLALGFEYEGTMKRYTDTGRDCDLYARAGGMACKAPVSV